MGFGLYAAHRGFSWDKTGIPTSLWSDYHRDRDAWCAENGCARPGTKTCIEVCGRPCEARIPWPHGHHNGQERD